MAGDSVREFLGLTADEWRTIATFVGPTVAVMLTAALGIWRFARELEAREVRDRYLVEGISKLKRNLNSLITVNMLNYQTANQLWRTFRDYPKGFPLEPNADDLPALVPIGPELISFEPVAIAQEVLGIGEVALWCGHIFADTSLATKEYEAQVRGPLLSYYKSASPPEVFANREAVLEELRQLIDYWNERAARHGQLFSIIHDLEATLLSKRLSLHRQVPGLKNDPGVKSLAALIVSGYEELKAHMAAAGKSPWRKKAHGPNGPSVEPG